MNTDDERIARAVGQTEILRAPKQTLASFGITNIAYYLLTEPIYSEMVKDTTETVIREGRVIAERPRIVTPYYLSRLEGFSPEARKYLNMLIKVHGGNAPGLFYTYRNEPKELNIVSGNLLAVVDKLNADIDARGDQLASIIKGEDELWDVSLMKFIYEVTRSSLQDNLAQMSSRGLLDTDASGIPADVRLRIDGFFAKVLKGELEPGELKAELDRWGLFDEYEDRFLALFKKRRF